jgi:hypothetical protein
MSAVGSRRSAAPPVTAAGWADEYQNWRRRMSLTAAAGNMRPGVAW